MICAYKIRMFQKNYNFSESNKIADTFQQIISEKGS